MIWTLAICNTQAWFCFDAMMFWRIFWGQVSWFCCSDYFPLTVILGVEYMSSNHVTTTNWWEPLSLAMVLCFLILFSHQLLYLTIISWLNHIFPYSSLQVLIKITTLLENLIPKYKKKILTPNLENISSFDKQPRVQIGNSLVICLVLALADLQRRV